VGWSYSRALFNGTLTSVATGQIKQLPPLPPLVTVVIKIPPSLLHSGSVYWPIFPSTSHFTLKFEAASSSEMLASAS
jgi:hypothetical protein